MENKNTIENEENIKTVVFNSNPNKEYSILYISSGKDDNLTAMGDELITDGDISNMTHRYKEEEDFYKSGSIIIKIKNASFTIVQSISNKKVNYAEIFTKIEDESKINTIKKLASIENDANGELLTVKRPYVRKILL